MNARAERRIDWRTILGRAAWFCGSVMAIIALLVALAEAVSIWGSARWQTIDAAEKAAATQREEYTRYHADNKERIEALELRNAKDHEALLNKTDRIYDFLVRDRQSRIEANR